MQVKKFSPLLELQTLLDQIGYEVVLVGKNESKEHPYEQLFISLDTKKWGPDRGVQIAFVNDMIIATSIVAKLETAPTSDLSPVQFIFVPRLKISEQKIVEFSQLLNHLNLLIPFGFWGLNKQEGIYFRYVLMNLDKKQLNYSVMVNIIEQLIHTINRLFPVIFALYKEKTSLPDAIKTLKEKYGLPF